MSIATIGTTTIHAAGLSATIKAAAEFTATARTNLRLFNNGFGRVRLSASAGTMTVESADGECRFSATTIGTENYGETAAAVDAAALKPALRAGFDSVDVDAESSRLFVGGLSVDAADTMDASYLSDIRETYTLSDYLSLHVETDAATFAMIDKTIVPATDTESSRYALGGVRLECEPPTAGDRYYRTHAIGTDGRRLHVLTISGSACVASDSPASGGVALVPAGIVRRVAKAIKTTTPRGLSASGVAVSILGDAGGEFVSISWRIGTTEFTVCTKQVEGRFPRWRDVFPDRPNFHANEFSGDADDADGIETWRADAATVAAACRDAATGVCKPTSRYSGALSVAFQSADGRPKLSASTAAGEFLQELEGVASAGFAARLDPKFVRDALGGFGKDENCRFYHGKTESRGEFTGDGIFLMRRNGFHNRHGVGFSAVIMPRVAD